MGRSLLCGEFCFPSLQYSNAPLLHRFKESPRGRGRSKFPPAGLVPRLREGALHVMTTITADQIIAWIERYSMRIAAEKEFLTKLDSDIGDADHGANMHRGFQAVLAKKSELQGKDIGTLLKIVAMTLISTVGGASGALYGTFFLQASSVTTGKTELTPAEFLLVLEKGLAGIVLRGKAAMGDKTMVDALHPAVKACRQSIEANEPLEQALANAVNAAEAGLQSTIPLMARRGRASYLGERSINHQDPGATSTFFLLQAAAETLAKRHDR